MKHLYPLIGLVLIVGVSYAVYTYGINRGITPANKTSTNTTNTPTNTYTPSTEWPSYGNTTNTVTDVGAKTLTITSPRNGQVIQVTSSTEVPDWSFEGFSFYVTGKVSPNANKIQVIVYSSGSWEGMAQPVTEKKTDDYYLTKFELGDTSWSYKVTAGENGNLMGESARFVVKAYYTDGTTKTATVGVSYTYIWV